MLFHTTSRDAFFSYPPPKVSKTQSQPPLPDFSRTKASSTFHLDKERFFAVGFVWSIRIHWTTYAHEDITIFVRVFGYPLTAWQQLNTVSIKVNGKTADLGRYQNASGHQEKGASSMLIQILSHG